MTSRERALLAVTVTLAGAVVLILEILGSRLMAPIYGTTLFVWSSLISVTMLALAIGYAVGGRLADRFAPLALLYRFLAVAGWLVLLIPVVRAPILTGSLNLGISLGGLVAAFLLLVPSLVFLGCVAPLAAKSFVGGMAELGGGVGILYALSTVGSLIGAIAAGFLLIPFMGVTKVLYFSALLLFIPAGIFWQSRAPGGGRRIWRIACVAGILVCLAGFFRTPEFPVSRGGGFQVLYKTDGRYSEVKVVQRGSIRLLLLDGTLQTAQEQSTHLPLFPYAPALQGLLFGAMPEAHDILLIGFGGGTLAESMAEAGARVQSVEIDPAVIRVAMNFFVKRGDLPVYLEDGRTFLERIKPASFDAIVVDAYAGEAPPPHLLTAEFYALVRRALRPGGVGVANLISYGKGKEARLARCAGRTIGAVFPWVEAYAVDDTDMPTNVLFVFGDKSRRLASLAPVRMLSTNKEFLKGFLSRRVELAGADGFAFTDEFIPAERFSLAARQAMRRHLVQLFTPWVLLE